MGMRNWYHRPDDQPASTAARKDRALKAGAATLLTFALLLCAALLPSRSASAPETPSAQVDAAKGTLLQKDCQLVERLSFTPCGHALTRREHLPEDLIGKTRADLEAAYDEWRVTSFSPSEVELSRQLAMYCPQHVVLMADESGMLCVWQNTYGDALSRLKELNVPLTDLPDTAQEQLTHGLGFDTQDALTQWLENAES